MHLCMWGGGWYLRGQRTTVASVLSLLHMGPTQLIRLGAKWLYQLSHLDGLGITLVEEFLSSLPSILLSSSPSLPPSFLASFP